MEIGTLGVKFHLNVYKGYGILRGLASGYKLFHSGECGPRSLKGLKIIFLESTISHLDQQKMRKK